MRDLTDGGVDYSFEAIGLKTTAEQGYEMLRRERKIQGSSMGSNRFRTDMPSSQSRQE